MSPFVPSFAGAARVAAAGAALDARGSTGCPCPPAKFGSAPPLPPTPPSASAHDAFAPGAPPVPGAAWLSTLPGCPSCPRRRRRPSRRPCRARPSAPLPAASTRAVLDEERVVVDGEDADRARAGIRGVGGGHRDAAEPRGELADRAPPSRASAPFTSVALVPRAHFVLRLVAAEDADAVDQVHRLRLGIDARGHDDLRLARLLLRAASSAAERVRSGSSIVPLPRSLPPGETKMAAAAYAVDAVAVRVERSPRRARRRRGKRRRRHRCWRTRPRRRQWRSPEAGQKARGNPQEAVEDRTVQGFPKAGAPASVCCGRAVG